MAYSTLAQVQTFFPNLTFGASTTPTSTEVTNTWIPRADAIIDGHLREHYATPITNATDLTLLEVISSRLAAQMIYDALLANATAGDLGANPAGSTRQWEREAMALLDRIVSGQIDLVTARATLTTDGGNYASSTTLDDVSFTMAQKW